MIPDARADDQRVVFVTDLHLSLRRPYYQDNWDMVVAWINAEKPPLREVGFIDFRLGQGEALGCVRHALIGREFLFRHESYIRIAEYGSVTSGPEQVIL
jgi:hypothetical protein